MGAQAKRGEEKCLAVLPLFHAFGMTAVMNLSLLIGAEIILLPKFQPTELLETIDREKPTIFFGVPTMYSALIAARDIAKYDLSSLKFCISGGAPLAARDPAPVRGSFRMHACRRLRAERGQPGLHGQSAGGRRQAGIGRAAAAGHGDRDRLARGSRPPPRPGRARRDLHHRAAGDGGLCQPGQGECRHLPRQAPAHRRRRLSRRGRLSLHRRPDQGPDHQRRLQRLSAPGRGSDPLSIPPLPRSRSAACPTCTAAKSSRPSSSCATAMP